MDVYSLCSCELWWPMGHPAVRLATALVLVACTDEAMMMSMDLAASKGLGWVCDPTATGSHLHGLCCHQKSCGDAWSVLSLTVKLLLLRY